MIKLECPGCGSECFEDSFEHFDGFCEQCGLVIEDFANPESVALPEPFEQSETVEPSKPTPSWLEFVGITNATEQRFAKAINEIENLGDDLNFSVETRQRAVGMYKEAMLNNSTDGRTTDVLVAALLHLASRENGAIRPVSTLANCVEKDGGRISSLVRRIQHDLELNIPVASPEHYFPHIYDTVDLDHPVTSEGERLLNVLREEGRVTGRNPAGIAGAIIYEVSDGVCTQREIAEASGVSTETLRQRLNDLREIDEVAQPSTVKP